MKTNYEDLFHAGVKELQFANMQAEYLLSVLNELDSFTGTLEKAVIKNARERFELDKAIHAKLLFK
jgi:hypothetical protein